jgi:hypothetical protein
MDDNIIELDNINQNICCICLNTEDDTSNHIKIDCCNQISHKKCLIDWIIVSNTCPICRKNYQFEKIIRLEEFILHINNDPELCEKLIENKVSFKKLLLELYADHIFIQIMNNDSEIRDNNENVSFRYNSFIIQIYWFFTMLLLLLLMIFLFSVNAKYKS